MKTKDKDEEEITDEEFEQEVSYHDLRIENKELRVELQQAKQEMLKKIDGRIKHFIDSTEIDNSKIVLELQNLKSTLKENKKE